MTRDRNLGPRRHPRVNSCPPVCAEHFNRRDGAPGCMSAATATGPCLRCGGRGGLSGGARCWPCAGTGALRRCRRHDFAALLEHRRRNRARGRCRCGALPDPGYSTCERCRSADTARRRRQRSTARDLPDRTLYVEARGVRRDSPVGRALRHRVRVLPLELRRYGPHGLLMPSDAELRAIDHRERTAPAQSMPGFDALSGRLQAFVRALVENGGKPYRRGPCGWLRRCERGAGRTCGGGGRVPHRQAALHRRRGARVPGAARPSSGARPGAGPPRQGPGGPGIYRDDARHVRRRRSAIESGPGASADAP